MKIGFWNRLAAVAMGAALLVAPVVAVNAWRDRVGADHRFDRELCMDNARSIASSSRGAFERCHQNYLREIRAVPLWSWEIWARAFIGAAISCIAIYGLFFVAVWLCKWVLRGRQAQA